MFALHLMIGGLLIFGGALADYYGSWTCVGIDDDTLDDYYKYTAAIPMTMDTIGPLYLVNWDPTSWELENVQCLKLEMGSHTTMLVSYLKTDGAKYTESYPLKWEYRGRMDGEPGMLMLYIQQISSGEMFQPSNKGHEATILFLGMSDVDMVITSCYSRVGANRFSTYHFATEEVAMELLSGAVNSTCSTDNFMMYNAKQMLTVNSTICQEYYFE